MKEFTINAKNLLYRVLLSWRMMILLAVIFAVLANCYGIYSNNVKVKSKNTSSSVRLARLENNITLAKDALSESEIKDTEDRLDTYFRLDEQYSNLQKYLEESKLMHIDYQKAAVWSLSYYVDDHYRVEYPVMESKSYAEDIAFSYSIFMQDMEIVDSIANIYGIEAKYVPEMIRTNARAQFFNIDIVGENEEQCSQVAILIKNYIEELKKRNPGNFPKHDLILESDTFTMGIDDFLYEAQIKKINELNNLRTLRINVQSGMLENQKKYFLSVVEYRDLMNEEKTNYSMLNTIEIGNSISETTHTFIYKKLIVIGALLGILLGFLGAVFSYVLVPVIRVKENLSDGLHQQILGTVWLSQGKKKFAGFVDHTITKWFYGREGNFEFEKRIDMLGAGIRINMEKENLNNVFITGASERADSVIEGLKERIGKEYDVRTGECIIYNPEALKHFSESEAVVFVETAGDSRTEEVLKEIDLANRSKVRIIGFVLVQD